MKVADAMPELADKVLPKLLEDGMFLVGLDIVGTKLMEVNVVSPRWARQLREDLQARFTDAVIDALEHKIDLRLQYTTGLPNTRWAIL